MNKTLDRIRGCLVGGAVGDALGYPVEFRTASQIRYRYGQAGITNYTCDRSRGEALISDDTQMTLFTAAGVLEAQSLSQARIPVAAAYQDWLLTQETPYIPDAEPGTLGLMALPELFACRAPGVTCLSALRKQCSTQTWPEDYIASPQNSSKGCGGVMRVAPLALRYWQSTDREEMDWEGAQLAAITHGHSLGYMPAAVLTHILSRSLQDSGLSPEEIVAEARDAAERLFAGDKHLDELRACIDRALELAAGEGSDAENIRLLGEGWVAEETLAISLYCALRHQDDFSAGIIASVNHDGDSDSTGAVTGNLLGAWLGYEAIGERWTRQLELHDTLLQAADELYAVGLRG